MKRITDIRTEISSNGSKIAMRLLGSSRRAVCKYSMRNRHSRPQAFLRLSASLFLTPSERSSRAETSDSSGTGCQYVGTGRHRARRHASIMKPQLTHAVAQQDITFPPTHVITAHRRPTGGNTYTQDRRRPCKEKAKD